MEIKMAQSKIEQETTIILKLTLSEALTLKLLLQNPGFEEDDKKNLDNCEEMFLTLPGFSELMELK